MKIQGSLGGADALPPYLLEMLLRQQQAAGPLARGLPPMGGSFGGLPDPLGSSQAGMPGGTNPAPMPMQPIAPPPPEPMVAEAPREPLRLTVRPQQSLPLPPQRPPGLLDGAPPQPQQRPSGGILDPGRPPPVPTDVATAFAPVGTGMRAPGIPPQGMKGQVLPLPPPRPPEFSAPPGGPNPDASMMLDIARGGPGILGGMGAASTAGILGGGDFQALANMPQPPMSLLDLNGLGGLFPSFFGGW